MVLRHLSGLWRCSWPAPAAVFVGAVVDEWHHAGFTVWMTLCQTSAPAPWESVGLQVDLMPAMATALLAVMAWQWLRVWSSGRHRPPMLLVCQVSCLVAMLFAGGICAGLASAVDTRTGQLLVMGLLDLAVSLSLAGTLVLGGLAVNQRWSPSDAVLHVQQHRR